MTVQVEVWVSEICISLCKDPPTLKKLKYETIQAFISTCNAMLGQKIDCRPVSLP